jgi:hypothetical protein
MSVWFWLLLLVFVVALYLNQTAGRLDRLHIKVDQARAALDEQLLRRSAVVSELATAAVLDPAASLVLAEAAHEARAADPDRRARAQSDLTEALSVAFEDPAEVALLREDPATGELLDELAGSSRRVQLARQFLEDSVRACVRVRDRRTVRWLRLAGRAPWPRSETFSDEPPRALVSS